MKHAFPAASAVLAVLGTSTALADPPAAAPDWSVSLGIASFSAPGWLGDDNYRTGLAPSLDVGYKGRVFASTTEGIGANLVRHGGWRAGPVLAYHPGRQEDGSEPFFVDDDDSTDLVGLGDVDATPEIGGFVEYATGSFLANVAVRQGLDGHEGLVGEGALEWTGAASVGGAPFSFAVGPALVVGDADYVGAFFGIDAAQSAASGLSVHDAGGGLVSYGLHGSVVVPLTSRVSLIGFGAYDVLGEEPGDSPLVEAHGSDEQGLLGVSVAVSL